VSEGSTARVRRARLALLLFALCAAACGGASSAPEGLLSDAALRERLGVDADELEGDATWYGERHHGRTTASGEPFDMHDYTAAHRTLPFGTLVRVIRQDTGQSVIVRINDRGPYGPGRVIDLSRRAAEDIALIRPGHRPVWIELLEVP
jgi:rare lipoprotein A